MGEEEPESENGLGKDIEDGVCNDLGVNVDVARSIGDTPDAITCQCFADPEEAREPTLGRGSK